MVIHVIFVLSACGLNSLIKYLYFFKSVGNLVYYTTNEHYYNNCVT